MSIIYKDCLLLNFRSLHTSLKNTSNFKCHISNPEFPSLIYPDTRHQAYNCVCGAELGLHGFLLCWINNNVFSTVKETMFIENPTDVLTSSLEPQRQMAF